MRKFIFTVSIFSIVETVLLTILHIFYVYQFTFGDYIRELYQKFGLDMDDDKVTGNHITSEFEDVFNN